MRGGPSIHRRRRAPVRRRYLLPVAAPPVYCHVRFGMVSIARRAPRTIPFNHILVVKILFVFGFLVDK